MKFALTEQLLDEARRFELRSACLDCFFWRPVRTERSPSPARPGEDERSEGRTEDDDPVMALEQGQHRDQCAHDWPDEGQRRWPLDAPNPDGSRPTEVAFCKEFELR